MIICDQTIADGVSVYLKKTQGRDVTVVGLERIYGGASRETYRVRLSEGISTAARMAMIATTTSASSSVKPRARLIGPTIDPALSCNLR